VTRAGARSDDFRTTGARRVPPVTLLVLGICWFTVISDGYDVVVYGAVLPSLLAEPGWGLNPAGAGLIGSLALLGMFVGSLTVGMLTDVIGRRRTLIGCLVWFSVFTVACAFATSPATFGALRLVAGLGLGGVLPTASALTAEYSPRRLRNVVYAVMFSGFPLGGILAAVLGIGLLPAYGWRAMFLAAAVPLIVVVPVAVVWLPESVAYLVARGRREAAEAIARRHGLVLPEPPGPAATGDGATPVRQLFSGRYRLATACFLGTTFLCLFMIYGLNTWLPQIMRGAGYSLGGALTFLLVFNLGSILGSVVVGTVADRLGSKPTLVGTFLLAAVTVSLLSVRLPQPVLYLLVGLGGLGTLGTQTFILAYVSKHYPARMAATALGWTLGVGRLGSVAAPPALGLIIGSGLAFGWNFFVIGLAGLLGAALIAAVPRAPAVDP
jgi:AAHS family benzoate transporter-like MFS transporter